MKIWLLVLNKVVFRLLDLTRDNPLPLIQGDQVGIFYPKFHIFGIIFSNLGLKFCGWNFGIFLGLFQTEGFYHILGIFLLLK